MVANNPHGTLMGVHDEGIIYGWIASLDNSETTDQKIYLVANQTALGNTVAYYQDTPEATQLGFALIPPYSLVAKLTPGTQLRAYFDPDHTQELQNSPIILDKSSLTNLLHRAFITHPPKSYLENIRSDGIVYGWAVDPYALDQYLAIYLYADAIPLCKVEADIFREDLHELGMGDGHHGFGFALETRPDLLEKIQAGMPIHAYFDAERRHELAHSPVRLPAEILEALLKANPLSPVPSPTRHSQPPPLIPAHLINIAPEGRASQSSLSEDSTADDAQGAINGIKTGTFGFCTGLEYRPWWQVDLGFCRDILAVAVYNREDAHAERAKYLTLEYSEDGGYYHMLCTTYFTCGGIISNRPLYLQFPQSLPLRYLRITLNGRAHLHLDQVELFVASQEASLTDNTLLPLQYQV